MPLKVSGHATPSKLFFSSIYHVFTCHYWQLQKLRRYHGVAVRNTVPTSIIFDAEYNGSSFGAIGALLEEFAFGVVVLTSPDENSLFLFLFSKFETPPSDN